MAGLKMGLGKPGRLALRDYTDPNIDPKYAPSRGGIGALYDARLRASLGKPLSDIGGPEAIERALRAYEGNGSPRAEAPTSDASQATMVMSPEGGARAAAEAERRKAKSKSRTILEG